MKTLTAAPKAAGSTMHTITLHAMTVSMLLVLILAPAVAHPLYSSRFTAPAASPALHEQSENSSKNATYAPPITPVVGTVTVLVLAVSFQDVRPSTSIAQLKSEWFGVVSSYYHEVSFGKLTVKGDVYGWYQLPHSEAYYGRDCHAINDPNCSGTNESWKIANDTVPLAEKDVNFSNYDYYIFLHAGTGQETSLNTNDIWSVTYLNASINTPTKTITRFSIVPELEAPPNVPNGDWCVEFAHDLGIPDLYNTNNGPNHGTTILGPWDLMDKGAWNGDPPGSLPAEMTAWEKIQLGWMNSSMLITAPAGTTTTILAPTEVSSDQVHAIKIIIDSALAEYYLVEVRQLVGFDAALPRPGVLITLVNETHSIGIVSLINSDPGEADLEYAVWQQGETFSDSLHAITINIIGTVGNSYSVEVTVGVHSPAVRLESGNSTAKILIAGIPLTVILATNLSAQEKGLSGVASLPQNEGMLFVFDASDYWSFWMIDMRFSLDIIWFNATQQVVWIQADMQPCTSSDCPTLTPPVPSMYVLEVNAGFVAAHNIALGTSFSFSAA